MAWMRSTIVSRFTRAKKAHRFRSSATSAPAVPKPRGWPLGVRLRMRMVRAWIRAAVSRPLLGARSLARCFAARLALNASTPTCVSSKAAAPRSSKVSRSSAPPARLSQALPPLVTPGTKRLSRPGSSARRCFMRRPYEGKSFPGYALRYSAPSELCCTRPFGAASQRASTSSASCWSSAGVAVQTASASFFVDSRASTRSYAESSAKNASGRGRDDTTVRALSPRRRRRLSRAAASVSSSTASASPR
mmetsp:Transcript_14916/g.48379  ORF Transcript_14916/g.48379 Transcript_14916/m.48379 type:complete len:248 (-) Transcript_14916:41-784(-)